jgi:hypothetical protein
MTVLLFIITCMLIPAIFFLITQQNLLKAISPENRSMSPGEVWLQLIPLFNLVWQFFVVIRISDSIKKELEYRHLNSFLGIGDPEIINELGKRPAYDIGIAYCILVCCCMVPCISTFAGLAALVCWIVYWVRLADYKRKLTNFPQF